MGSAVLLLSRFIGLQWDTSEAVRLAEERSASAGEAVDRLANNVGTLEQHLAIAEESKTIGRDGTTTSTDEESNNSATGVTENNSEESRCPIDGVRVVEGGRGCDGVSELPRCLDGAGQAAPSAGGQVTVAETAALKIHQLLDRDAYEPAAARAGLREAGGATLSQQSPARGSGPTTAAIDMPASEDAAPRSSRPAPLQPIGGEGRLPKITLLAGDTGEGAGNGPTGVATTSAETQPAQDRNISGEVIIREVAATRDETAGGDTWPRAGTQPARHSASEQTLQGHTIAERNKTQEHIVDLLEPGQVLGDDDAGGSSDIGDGVRRGISIPQEKEGGEDKGIGVTVATLHVSSADRGETMGDAEVSSRKHRNDTRRDTSRDGGDTFSGRTSGSWTSRSGDSHSSDRNNTDGRHDAGHARNTSPLTIAPLPAIRSIVDRVPPRGSENERVDEVGTAGRGVLLRAEEDNAFRSMLPSTQRVVSSMSPVPAAGSNDEQEGFGLVLSASRPLASISARDQGQGEGVSDGEASSRTSSGNSGSRDGRNNQEDFVTIGVDSAIDVESSCTAQGGVVATDERSTDALAAASPQADAVFDDASDLPAVDVTGQSMSTASRPTHDGKSSNTVAV